jgi:hypothetical protein
MTSTVTRTQTTSRREFARDAASHGDVPPGGRGQDSPVSQAALTKLAYQVRDLPGGPQQPSGPAGDLAANVNAASVPPRGAGQAPISTGDGARDGVQNNQTRGTGLGPQGK